MSFTRSQLLIVPALCLAAVTAALGCQVPVFRYALERWEADPYALVIVPAANGLSADEQAVEEFLRDPAQFANLEVRVESSLPNDTGQARMDLYYPRVRQDRPIWSGPATLENARQLLDSPVRREIVKRLLAGQSSVWLLVGSGNGAKDSTAAQDLAQHIEAAKGILEIPEGVVLHADAAGRQDVVPVKPEDVLHSPVPLMIDFSTIQLSRNDPAEAVLLAMLLNLEDDLGDYAAEPMAFPVFGRGRVREPLIGLGLNKDNVFEYSGYLCGACSCEVKEQNPGRDLLVAADWEKALSGSEVVEDQPTEPAAADIVVVKPQEKPKPQVAATMNSPLTLLLTLSIIAAGWWFLRRNAP